MTSMTAPRITPAAQPALGLRERKKIKTRRAIRTATYALIEEQGYDATTIEQIADRAEVSPSTVLRYFPAKEDIVVTDEWDPVMTAELRARPADETWADTLRYVMRTALDLALSEEPDVIRLRTRLGVEVPAVRARMLENAAATGRLLRDALAERSGLDPDSLELRVLTMSVMGGLMEVSHYWAETGHRDDIRDLVDRALDVLEHGLPAGKP
ncbi:TetR/AcrR family transcriptional regulator [Streptomyces sp. WAC04114]|uniref:TetR/AcrR family transcriptional regulator n=1 Tax=Streptomyces sp. WAC04114 TaxID=2867961 RepID=UPI001C8B1B03|nr:TetR family transcriptional regulator [Streptomyces sp. WAC04114]MBX9360856.1 TetR family transcriptional regulator [Streptomyces sp. WAC04114]